MGPTIRRLRARQSHPLSVSVPPLPRLASLVGIQARGMEGADASMVEISGGALLALGAVTGVLLSTSALMGALAVHGLKLNRDLLKQRAELQMGLQRGAAEMAAVRQFLSEKLGYTVELSWHDHDELRVQISGSVMDHDFESAGKAH